MHCSNHTMGGRRVPIDPFLPSDQGQGSPGLLLGVHTSLSTMRPEWGSPAPLTPVPGCLGWTAVLRRSPRDPSIWRISALGDSGPQLPPAAPMPSAGHASAWCSSHGPASASPSLCSVCLSPTQPEPQCDPRAFSGCYWLCPCSAVTRLTGRSVGMVVCACVSVAPCLRNQKGMGKRWELG